VNVEDKIKHFLENKPVNWTKNPDEDVHANAYDSAFTRLVDYTLSKFQQEHAHL